MGNEIADFLDRAEDAFCISNAEDAHLPIGLAYKKMHLKILFLLKIDVQGHLPSGEHLMTNRKPMKQLN